MTSKLQDIEECIQITNVWISELEHVLTYKAYKNGTLATKSPEYYEEVLDLAKQNLVGFMQERMTAL